MIVGIRDTHGLCLQTGWIGSHFCDNNRRKGRVYVCVFLFSFFPLFLVKLFSVVYLYIVTTTCDE